MSLKQSFNMYTKNQNLITVILSKLSQNFNEILKCKNKNWNNN